jgi:uncharacterized membrane protein
MTLATLGSIFIVLGIAVIAAGVALPVAYRFRMRTENRPLTTRRRPHRAPAPQVERVSA